MMPRPLLHGAATNVVSRIGTLALGLAVLVVVARMGPQVQGALALLMAAEALLVALGSGLGLLLAREVSHHGRAAGAALRSLLWRGLALGALAGFGLALLAGWSAAEPYRSLWMLALAAPCLLLAPTAGGLWLGQGRMAAMNLPLLAAPAAVLAGLLALDGLGLSGLVPVLAVWVLAKAGVGLATAAAALHQVRPDAGSGSAEAVGADGADAAAATVNWRFVAGVGLTNAVSLLNLRLTLFLLERHDGLAAAGVYSVAVQVAELVWLLSSAVTLSAYRGIGEPNRGQAARLTLRAVRLNLGLALLAAPPLALVAWFGLPALLGSAYAEAAPPLLLLLPGIVCYAPASALSAYYTNQRGRPQWSAAVAGASLLLTLAIAAWSIPALGARGAALATSLAYMVAASAAIGWFLRDQGWTWRALLRTPG